MNDLFVVVHIVHIVPDSFSCQFKMSPSAKLFLGNELYLQENKKNISTLKAEYLTSFLYRDPGYSQMTYWAPHFVEIGLLTTEPRPNTQS